MATPSAVKEQMSRAPAVIKAPNTLESLLKDVNIRGKFEDMLGKKAAGFISSIISVANQNKDLRACDPKTVIAAAAVAASIDLPINPSLGFAAIVPYKEKSGTLRAQFQMMWRGFVQLGMRSGQYEDMNTSEVYEDELSSWNPITGEIRFTDPKTWKMRDEGKTDKIVGFVAFFKLLNGFRKFLYMSKAQMTAHGRRYSKSFEYDGSQWKRGFDGMGRKTVIKLLLSKFGIMSVEMQTASRVDQAIIKDLDAKEIEYADAKALAAPDDVFETSAVAGDDTATEGQTAQEVDADVVLDKEGNPMKF